MLLNPDQKNVMIGPNRQLIIGPAGTGKTILLQAKALECLAQGKSVYILSPGSNKANWEKLLRKYNSASYKIFDYTEFWDLLGFDVPHFEPFKKYLRKLLTNDKYRSQLFEALQAFQTNGNKFAVRYDSESIIPIRLWHDLRQRPIFSEMANSSFNFFFDDLLGQIFRRDEDILFLISLFVMAMAQQFYPENITWAAFDLYQFGDFAYNGYQEKWLRIVDLFQNILPHYVKSKLCSISHLQGVMRCSQGVYDSAYSDILWPQTPLFGIDPEKLRPHLGHKIMGMETISIRDTTTNDNLLIKAVALLDDAKERLVRSGFDFNCRFAVILSIPLNISTLCNQIAYSLRSRFPNHTLTNVVDGLKIEGNTITVTLNSLSGNTDVYSLEWPLVIHICVPPRFVSEDISLKLFCEKYLGRFRATTALVDIFLELVD